MSISIYPTIIKSKRLLDGSHRIRIAVSCHNTTCYLLTRFTIPSDKNFKRQEVCGLPDASVTNRKLRERVNELYDIYDKIPNAEILSCRQITDILKDGGLEHPSTLEQIEKEWLDSKVNIKESTKVLYSLHLMHAEKHFGKEYQLSRLSPSSVNKFLTYIKGIVGTTTVSMIMTTFRGMVRFAERRKIVQYSIDPFIDYREMPRVVRDVAITVEQLRKIRDSRFRKPHFAAARDYFLFSFYCCGMNQTDIFDLDITQPVIRFRRRKTENRRGGDEWTEFTMQPEAKKIAEKSIFNDMLMLHKDYKRCTVNRIFYQYLEDIRKEVIPECPRLIMYSARKTFAQLAAELGIQDSVIEYCLGDAPSKSRVINYYRKVNRNMADRAIREVLDFVASDLSVEQWLEYKTSGKTLEDWSDSDK